MNIENEKNIFINFLKSINYYHIPHDLTNDNQEYYKNIMLLYTFFKFLLIVVLFIISIFTMYYYNKEIFSEFNIFNFFVYELLIAICIFFLPLIFMYIIRWEKINITNNLIIFGIISLVIIIFKHIAYEVSGVYRYKYSTHHCYKSKKKSKKCICNDSVMNGPLWQSMEIAGILITIILLYYFNFNIYIVIPVLLILLITPLIIKYINPMIEECSKYKENYRTNISGFGIITLLLLLLIFFLPVIILYKWHNGCYENNCIENYGYIYLKFILIFIESIMIFIITMLFEGIIKILRLYDEFNKDKYNELINKKEFWINTKSSVTFVLILYLQIILEYSYWYKYHLFEKETK